MRQSIAAFSCLCAFVAASATQAQNLLLNGSFELPPAEVYYDGSNPDIADDEPGWIAFLGAADGSYVLMSPETEPAAGGTDLDMAIGPAGGGIRTAPLARPVVVPGLTYRASLTYDNYFAPTGAAYFIDWFDVGGSLLSSVGGPLGDPNGGLTYAPYTQLLSVVGAAPAGASTAGVRFTAGNAGYAGLAADNFSFGIVPEPSSVIAAALAVISMLGASRRRLS